MVRFLIALAAGLVVAASAAPALAQFSNSYEFIEAVRNSDMGEARERLKRAHANVRDIEGVPVLVIAAEQGNIDMMRLLLDNNANIDGAARNDGQTALMRVASLRNQPAVTFLLERGADPNAKDKGGETALIKAARLRSARIVRLLLEAGADPELTDYRGLTALDHARNARARSVVRLLESGT